MANRFGGMTREEIRSGAMELPGNAGASPKERFLFRISNLVSVRQGRGEAGGLAVFLLSDILESDAEGLDGEFHPCIASGNDPILQQVWLSNAGLGGAYRLHFNCDNHTSLFAEIKKAKLGRLPALVIDWRGEIPAGQFFGSGIDVLEDVQDVMLAFVEISHDDLKNCLDHFHRTSLQTPQRIREGHAEAVWTDAARGWPANRPEERIQGKLIQHLRSRYTKHNVRAETVNDDGIADLVIYANTHDAAGEKIVVKEWVLELKALTDKTKTGNDVDAGTAKEAIEKGLTQVIAYREKEHARKAALCFYDMRERNESDDDCFAAIADEAKAECVSLWRWFLFRTSEASRVADRDVRRAKAC